MLVSGKVPVAKRRGIPISCVGRVHGPSMDSAVEVVGVNKDFYAWSLQELLQFVVLADQGHVGIRTLGFQFPIDLRVRFTVELLAL